ncbi:MAG: hypothetical protein RLZZ419_1995 [Pseudomonadota bacterium]|jgi:DNA invertase Pin-like site-specific DNA recombinase
MGYTRGKPLKPGEKRAIVCVKNYFYLNKKDFGITESSAQLTADALEIGVSTVNRVMADLRRDPSLLDKTPESKGRTDYAINSSQ